MAKWTRISLSLLTLLTAAFIILGALLPTFVAKVGPAKTTVGLFKTCTPKGYAENRVGGTSIDTDANSFDGAFGLTCVDNDKIDQRGGNWFTGAKSAAHSAKESIKGAFNKEDKIDHVYQTRPTAEKVSAGFVCTAGVITALIGFFTMFPSTTVFAYTYMISPIVLHVIGMALAIWTGIERYNAYPTTSGASRTVGAGLALQIVSLLMLIVLAGLWTLPSARKTVVTKYGA